MVKSGDTMYTIAQKHGVKLDQLVAYNPQISNPEQIEVGMKVKIPSAVDPDGIPGVEYTHKHTVVQGDSLWKIAKAWGLPLKALVDANPQLKNPSVLLTGEIVYIPKAAQMGNPGTSHIMNAAQSPNYTPILHAANNISPAYTPQPPIAPQQNIAPQQVIPPKPTSISPEQVIPPKPTSIAPEQVIPPKPTSIAPEQAVAPKPSIAPEQADSLFMQFDVPAVEATGKVESAQSYQLPAYYEAYMPQWEPTAAYAAKPDCGCGCGGKANVMPYDQYTSPYSYMPNNQYTSPYSYVPNNQYVSPESYMTKDQYVSPESFTPNNQYVSPETYMPKDQYVSPESFTPNNQYVSPETYTPNNQYVSPESYMPNYYIPQPMLGYNMQEPMQKQAVQTQYYNPMQYPASVAPSSPYGYMVPCYPMGAYGDMGYIHGMQTPYSPWINSNENTPPVNTLAESATNAALNDQMKGVLGTSDEEAPLNKRTKIPRNPSNRSSQKQDDLTFLHNFLRKKTSSGESAREYKLNEPWMKR
jgi:morphogenetic protein associated with SpoVID